MVEDFAKWAFAWQFLSPDTNLRDDEYGGDLIGRMRFLRELYDKVKEE